MADTLWIAEVETRNTSSRAFGATPEQAVEALMALWREDYAPRSGASPDFLAECREDISVSAFEVGKGYLKGMDDFSWHDKVLNGSDTRFDALIASDFPAP